MNYKVTQSNVIPTRFTSLKTCSIQNMILLPEAWDELKQKIESTVLKINKGEIIETEKQGNDIVVNEHWKIVDVVLDRLLELKILEPTEEKVEKALKIIKNEREDDTLL